MEQNVGSIMGDNSRFSLVVMTAVEYLDNVTIYYDKHCMNLYFVEILFNDIVIFHRPLPLFPNYNVYAYDNELFTTNAIFIFFPEPLIANSS